MEMTSRREGYGVDALQDERIICDPPAVLPKLLSNPNQPLNIRIRTHMGLHVSISPPSFAGSLDGPALSQVRPNDRRQRTWHVPNCDTWAAKRPSPPEID